MNEMLKEYRALFLEESEEHIAALNDNLIALEKNRSDRKLIDNIFRIAHTLKSSSAAVGFRDLSGLAHKAEESARLSEVDEMALVGILSTQLVHHRFIEAFQPSLLRAGDRVKVVDHTRCHNITRVPAISFGKHV